MGVLFRNMPDVESITKTRLVKYIELFTTKLGEFSDKKLQIKSVIKSQRAR